MRLNVDSVMSHRLTYSTCFRRSFEYRHIKAFALEVDSSGDATYAGSNDSDRLWMQSSLTHDEIKN
jgi:hypothetical protein